MDAFACLCACKIHIEKFPQFNVVHFYLVDFWIYWNRIRTVNRTNTSTVLSANSTQTATLNQKQTKVSAIAYGLSESRRTSVCTFVCMLYNVSILMNKFLYNNSNGFLTKVLFFHDQVFHLKRVTGCNSKSLDTHKNKFGKIYFFKTIVTLYIWKTKKRSRNVGCELFNIANNICDWGESACSSNELQRWVLWLSTVLGFAMYSREIFGTQLNSNEM